MTTKATPLSAVKTIILLSFLSFTRAFSSSMVRFGLGAWELLNTFLISGCCVLFFGWQRYIGSRHKNIFVYVSYKSTTLLNKSCITPKSFTCVLTICHWPYKWPPSATYNGPFNIPEQKRTYCLTSQNKKEHTTLYSPVILRKTTFCSETMVTWQKFIFQINEFCYWWTLIT